MNMRRNQKEYPGPAGRRPARRRRRPAQGTPALLPLLLAGMAGAAGDLDPPGHPARRAARPGTAPRFLPPARSQPPRTDLAGPATAAAKAIAASCPTWRRLSARPCAWPPPSWSWPSVSASAFSRAAARRAAREDRAPEPGSRQPAAADDPLPAQPAFGVGPPAGDLADLARPGARPFADRGACWTPWTTTPASTCACPPWTRCISSPDREDVQSGSDRLARPADLAPGADRPDRPAGLAEGKAGRDGLEKAAGRQKDHPRGRAAGPARASARSSSHAWREYRFFPSAAVTFAAAAGYYLPERPRGKEVNMKEYTSSPAAGAAAAGPGAGPRFLPPGEEGRHHPGLHVQFPGKSQDREDR